MQVKLVSITKPSITIDGIEPSAEGFIAYCARVSSPNQENPDYAQLIRYCIKNKHWSIFEMVDMTVEITTSRSISPQILRHRSFCFQEFSQRYAVVTEKEQIKWRKQGKTNRQVGDEPISDVEQFEFDSIAAYSITIAFNAYNHLINQGVAKEVARMVLPTVAQTRLYMKGSVRSWIHYLEVRLSQHTQKEHRDIAVEIHKIFKREFPLIAESINAH